MGGTALGAILGTGKRVPLVHVLRPGGAAMLGEGRKVSGRRHPG